MIRIQIVDSSVVPSFMLEDGLLYLDVDEGTDVIYFELLQELNEIDEINDEAIFPLTVPATEKNKLVLGKFYYENLESEAVPIDVIVHNNTGTLLQDRLFVTNVDDSSGQIECELERLSDHWLEILRGVKLKDLFEGEEYEFTGNTILSSWSKDVFQDGEQGIVFPPAYYGRLMQRGTTIVEDYRLWIRPLWVIEKIACLTGFNWNWDWLETEAGRRLACYVLAKDLGVGNNDASLYWKRSEQGDANCDQGGRNCYAPFLVTKNNGDRLEPFNGSQSFRAVGVYDHSIKVNIEEAASSDLLTRFELRLIDDTTGEFKVIREFSLERVIGISSVEVNIVAVEQTANQRVVLVGTGINRPISLLREVEITWNITTRRALPSEGDIVQIKDMINPDYLALEFLKGLIHLCNGKILTDFANRSVSVFTPESADYFGDEIEGFFTDDVVEIKDVILRSRGAINIREKTISEVYLKFKDSTDVAIERLGLAEDEELYSRIIDLGDKSNADSVKEENPFFEPTLNRGVTISNTPVDLPHLIDNEENNVSFDIKPRIIFTKSGFFENDEGSVLLSFMGVSRANWMYGFQSANLLSQPLAGDPELIELFLGYGEHEQDLSRFWFNYLRSKNNFKEVTYSIHRDFDYFKGLSFRKLYKVLYDGREVVLRLAAKENVSLKSWEGDLTFLPDVYDGCQSVGEVEEDNCRNFPRIIISQDCFDYTFDPGGVFQDNVESEKIEISFNDGDTWIEQDSANCSDHEGNEFIVRLIVEFDNCPPLIVSRRIRPCNISSDATVICDQVGDCIELIRVGDAGCAENDTLDYRVNEGTWQEYTEPICGLEEGDVIDWKRDLEFDCCDTIEIEGQCIVGEIPFDCDLVELDFEWNAPFWDLQRIGNLTGFDVAVDRIQYRDNSNQAFRELNQLRIRQPYVEVQRVVILCNGKVCCSEIYILDSNV